LVELDFPPLLLVMFDEIWLLALFIEKMFQFSFEQDESDQKLYMNADFYAW
jgi:hypothetical protein